MLSNLKTFLANDDGAITVDYVVLCAAVVWLCVGAIDSVQGGVSNLAMALEQGISIKSTDNGD